MLSLLIDRLDSSKAKDQMRSVGSPLKKGKTRMRVKEREVLTPVKPSLVQRVLLRIEIRRVCPLNFNSPIKQGLKLLK